MKRWKLKLKDKEYEPIVYAKTETDAITCFKDEVVESVTLYENRDYLSYINKMLKNAMLEGIQHRNNNCDREWYKTDTAYGVLRFRLIKDCNDDSYFDYTDYQFVSNDCKVFPCTYEMSTPQKVCEKYFSDSPYCEIYSYRLYGEPKLVKPVELKGIKSSFIVDFIPNKCKCHCFVKDNDLWIKHRDFFSKSHRPALKDIGTPLTYRLQKYFNCDKNYLDKFMYPDSWGSIVLRNEAWIVFHNIKNFVLVDKIPPVVFVENMFLNTDLMKKSNIYNLSNEWDRFFENTLKTYIKYLKGEII